MLLSGGIDSSTCLYLAKKEYEAYALTINYYYRWDKEIEYTRKLAKASNTELLEIDAKFIKEAFHTINRFKDDDTRWPFYIPAKNLLFYAIAAHYAEYMNINAIIAGHHKEDMQFYGDATKEYISLLNAILKKGSMIHNNYEIITPLADLNKLEVVKLGYELNVPFELTWSCHERCNKHCGKCYGCLSRIKVFDKLGVRDPVEYER